MSTETVASDKKLFGLLAEFDNPKKLALACQRVYQTGFQKFDSYTPFPVHGLEKYQGLPESKLGWIVIAHSLIGFFGALTLMIFVSFIDYPLNISGKPFLNFPAFVPVTFELTILLSAFGAVFGMFFLNDLPRHNNPLFSSERFSKVTDDKFFLCIEAEDSLFDDAMIRSLYEELDATYVESIYED
jgi:hypothetical protein